MFRQTGKILPALWFGLLTAPAGLHSIAFAHRQGRSFPDATMELAMIRNIQNCRRHRSWERVSRQATGGAMLGVALAAFMFLGWLPGKAAFFAGFGQEMAEFRPYADEPDLRAEARVGQRDEVAAILSHWE